MAENMIDRIRSATFTVGRRGYDKREVDRFLAQVVDWLETGAGDPSRADIVKRELERVGERTGHILASAEESAEKQRSEAQAEAARTLESARSEAERLRTEAEAYAAGLREEVDSYAEQGREAAENESRRARLEASQKADELVAEAEQRAQQIVDDSLRKRRDLETLIADLIDRRNEVLDDTDRLAEELASLVAAHSTTDGAGIEAGEVEQFEAEAEEGEPEVAAEGAEYTDEEALLEDEPPESSENGEPADEGVPTQRLRVEPE